MFDCQKAMILPGCIFGIVGLLCFFFMMPKGGFLCFGMLMSAEHSYGGQIVWQREQMHRNKLYGRGNRCIDVDFEGLGYAS